MHYNQIQKTIKFKKIYFLLQKYKTAINSYIIFTGSQSKLINCHR